MKKHLNLFTIFMLAVILSSCASTRMTSFKDPSFRSSKFKRILVIANVSDLQWRQKVESRLVEAFKDAGVFAVEGVLFFPPTRTFSNEEKVDLLVSSNLDGYISVSVGDAGTTEVYVPPTSSTTTTKGSASVYGNQATYKSKSTTSYSGGYTLSKPWAEFDTKLVDVSSGQTAWVASSFTGGNAYANLNTVINSYCDKVVEQLIQDGLVNKLELR